VRLTSRAPWRRSSSAGRSCYLRRGGGTGRRGTKIPGGTGGGAARHLQPLRKVASPCYGWQGPAPGKGPRHQPLGLGGGAGTRLQGRWGAGLPAGSSKERRCAVGRVGKKGSKERDRRSGGDRQYLVVVFPVWGDLI
jgi:hypothetical protein